jgi:CheY-like chemotaxis protein
MKTVLIVDDVRTTRDRLRDLLAREGYAVIDVADGKQASDVLATTTDVGLIILDLVMPVMSGWEFRDFQLSEPHLAAIPTLILTVKKLADSDRYALRVGNATVLQKPVEDQDIIAAVSRMLSARTR